MASIMCVVYGDVHQQFCIATFLNQLCLSMHADMGNSCASHPLNKAQSIPNLVIIVNLYTCPVLNQHRVLSTIYFTSISVAQVSTVAPNLSKAKVSASRILSLIQRKTSIDAESDEGLKLVSTPYNSYLSICVKRGRMHNIVVEVPCHLHNIIMYMYRN